MPKLEEKPQVGQPCTIHVGSDSYAATVVSVNSSGKTIMVQHDTATAVGGPYQYGDTIEYEYSRNPNGQIETYTLRKNGRFIEKGGSLRHGCRLGLGYRREYRDPHF